MTVVLDKISEVQTQVVDALKSTKDPVSDGVSAVVGFVTERVASVPAVPFADQIPTPKEIIDNQYKFVRSLTETNKSIAVGVADAASPLTNQLLDRKPAAAKKPAAKKTAAKK